MTTTKKMLIGFTAGIILGVLYAPSRGAKTRRKLAAIGSTIKDGWNNISEKITDMTDNVTSSTLEKIEIRDFEVDDKAGYL
jgi:gas vesicle protein